MPSFCAASSMVRCGLVMVPTEPALSLPGLALAQATKMRQVLSRESAGTTTKGVARDVEHVADVLDRVPVDLGGVGQAERPAESAPAMAAIGRGALQGLRGRRAASAGLVLPPPRAGPGSLLALSARTRMVMSVGPGEKAITSDGLDGKALGARCDCRRRRAGGPHWMIWRRCMVKALLTGKTMTAPLLRTAGNAAAVSRECLAGGPVRACRPCGSPILSSGGAPLPPASIDARLARWTAGCWSPC